MRKNLSYIMLFAAMFLAVSARAQVSNGSYRALRATSSARVAALGGLVLPFHDGDIQTATFNPAAICPGMNNQLSFSYVGDFNLSSNYAAVQYAHDFEKTGSFCATLQYFNYGDFTETSEGGNVLGEFNASDYAFTLGWGRELTDKWSIGANLKYAGMQGEIYSCGALGVDVAATYWSYSDWALTLAARNIGHQLFCKNYDNNNGWMPFSLDFTASKKLEHLPFTFVFAYNDIQKWNQLAKEEEQYDPISGDLIQESGTRRFFKNVGCHFAIGGELEIGKNLVLRAAYNYGTHNKMTVPADRDLTGFSIGFGVKVKRFEIDYARSRCSIVGSPNYLTVKVNLNK
ncbi:MAG: type IX secretion system protein PorQ [Bacteroidales bacterium]|nr:type IX secretion system protein PorQ [Bacteroidales bacterium]